MAVNTTRAWTGSTIAPQTTPVTPPAAVPGSNIPPAVTGAANNLANIPFYNNLLSALFGGALQPAAPAAPAAPQIAPAQSAAINFAMDNIAAENWRRAKEADIRRFAGTGDWMTNRGIMSIAPNPMGTWGSGDELLAISLANRRLMPSVTLGTAAAQFGSGGAAPVVGGAPRSGWVSPTWGF